LPSLDHLEKFFGEKKWIAGEFTIADFKMHELVQWL